MRGYFGADRCCCTKQQNLWNVLDLGVECVCMSDVLPDDNNTNARWPAFEHGISPK